MTLQQVTLEIPEKVLLAEKTDAESFGREILVLAAVKLFEIGRFSSELAGDCQGHGCSKIPVIAPACTACYNNHMQVTGRASQIFRLKILK